MPTAPCLQRHKALQRDRLAKACAANQRCGWSQDAAGCPCKASAAASCPHCGRLLPCFQKWLKFLTCLFVRGSLCTLYILYWCFSFWLTSSLFSWEDVSLGKQIIFKIVRDDWRFIMSFVILMPVRVHSKLMGLFQFMECFQVCSTYCSDCFWVGAV